MSHRPRRRAIQKACNKLLQKHSVTSPPVCVEEIARKEGIRIFVDEDLDEDISGFLYRHRDTGPLIILNKDQSETRRRFTIAHELGHFVLHDDNSTTVSPFLGSDNNVRFRSHLTSQGIDTDEIEANQFAAQLLMPVDLIEQWILEVPENANDDEMIKFLADKFKVSPAAMKYRLVNLGYADISEIAPR